MHDFFTKRNILFIFILIFLLSLIGCGKQKEKVMIFSNASYWQSEKEIWITLPMDVMPPIVIPKEVQFMEHTIINATDLVTVIDTSPVEIHFYPYKENEISNSRSAEIGVVYEIIAIDAYGNETIVEVQPDVLMNPRREGIPRERVYWGCTVVPARDIECVDDKVYSKLKSIYDQVDWFGTFELGDPELYDLCKMKFKELLDNERTYLNPETQKETYVGNLFGYYETYYFFDMDLDHAPELVIVSPRDSYAFKYDPEQDKVILWLKDFRGNGEDFIGSRKTQWWISWEGYTIYDENWETACWIEYEADGYRDEETGEDVWILLISLPYYTDPEKQIELTDEMKSQCYYMENTDWYYFGVTEGQYEELMGHYLHEAYQKAEKEKEKVVFRSYGELFGE